MMRRLCPEAVAEYVLEPQSVSLNVYLHDYTLAPAQALDRLRNFHAQE